MSALVKKEIRLLLPSFLIGCVLTLANWFLFWKNLLLENTGAISNMLSLIPLVVCPAVAVMIALDSFGGEVSSGTFAMLLAQPVSRLKIWQTKISLLAGALLVVGVLWFGPIFCHYHYLNNGRDNSKDLYDLFVVAVTFALVVFSGGLWTVLLLRQVAAAFWFTLLVPGVILMILVGLFAGDSGEFIEGLAVSVLGLYSLAGFFFARRLFLRAQDVQWSGGTIAMPEMRGLPAWLARPATQRVLRPRAALWRKEIQLHQSQFVMAFALLLLHLGVLAVRHFYNLKNSPDLKFVLQIFWGLWLVMPVLAGCAAVAEERKIGTLEAQLCLPVKRRTQFGIKFFVAFFLSVLLGAVMPLLLEGTRILPDVHFELGSLEPGWQGEMSPMQIDFWIALGIFNGLLPLLTFAGIAASFGAIAFYISSLMRNTLQTLAPAVLGILLAFFAQVAVSQMRQLGLYFLWQGPLPHFVAAPVMALALLALAFGNFQQVRIGWKVWWWNFVVLLLALVFAVAATSAVYHRAWEKLTSFEPPHGAARLSPSNPVSLNTRWNDISVRLPDGKIWLSYFIQSPSAKNPLAVMLGNAKVAMDEGKFISGSNWLTVERMRQDYVGLKSDGSLWVSEKPGSGIWNANEDEMGQLVRFENETHWSSLAPAGYSALLVKDDGTLWRWGATNFDFKHHGWPGLRTFTPYRLGTESNWSKIFQIDNDNYLYFRKTDGSFWVWGGSWNTNGQAQLEIEPGFMLQSVKNLGRDKFRGAVLISHGLQYKVGVRDDGTFRIWADERLEFNKHYGYYEWFPTDLQIGDDTNWIAVAGGGDKIVTLKNDGSLWLWNFQLDGRQIHWNTASFEREIQATRPVRLGTHSDWIAISGGGGNVVALAADGSLWFWPLERSDYYFNDNGNGSRLEPLLDISRKPQLLGNVFSAALNR
jgi:ABC-type transport system involved in multi-copper enzyme maturation permease subunit